MTEHFFFFFWTQLYFLKVQFRKRKKKFRGKKSYIFVIDMNLNHVGAKICILIAVTLYLLQSRRSRRGLPTRRGAASIGVYGAGNVTET